MRLGWWDFTSRRQLVGLSCSSHLLGLSCFLLFPIDFLLPCVLSPSYSLSSACISGTWVILSAITQTPLSPFLSKPVLSSPSLPWAASLLPQSLPCFSLLSCSKPVSFPFCQPSPDSLHPSLLSFPIALFLLWSTGPVLSSPIPHEFIVLAFTPTKPQSHSFPLRIALLSFLVSLLLPRFPASILFHLFPSSVTTSAVSATLIIHAVSNLKL